MRSPRGGADRVSDVVKATSSASLSHPCRFQGFIDVPPLAPHSPGDLGGSQPRPLDPSMVAELQRNGELFAERVGRDPMTHALYRAIAESERTGDRGPIGDFVKRMVNGEFGATRAKVAEHAVRQRQTKTD